MKETRKMVSLRLPQQTIDKLKEIAEKNKDSLADTIIKLVDQADN